MLIGLPLNDWLDKHFYNPTVVALMLLLYGAGFLFVERYNRSRKPRVNSIAALRWSDARRRRRGQGRHGRGRSGRREDAPSIFPVISDFFDWLRAVDLMQVYQEKWAAL